MPPYIINGHFICLLSFIDMGYILYPKYLWNVNLKPLSLHFQTFCPARFPSLDGPYQQDRMKFHFFALEAFAHPLSQGLRERKRAWEQGKAVKGVAEGTKHQRCHPCYRKYRLRYSSLQKRAVEEKKRRVGIINCQKRWCLKCAYSNLLLLLDWYSRV